MAQKRSSDVVYKPLSDTSQIPQIEEVKTQDIQNYQDPGVSFNGYSKIKAGANQYKLFRQQGVIRAVNFGWTGTNTDLSLSINPEFMTKRFFITGILFQFYSNTDTIFKVHDITDTQYFRLLCLAGSTTVSRQFMEFKTPIEFPPEIIFTQPYNLSLSAPVAITGRMLINIFGYLEDKA